MVYYNEFDKKAAATLRELSKAGLIARGEVDDRSICDVTADDLKGYAQCHFFAGIGGWSYALRLAGWPDERPVWTGSCPCQPFSAAGKRKGTRDKRHLWPDFRRLIRVGTPAVVFGEQVASKDGREWVFRVRADLERMGRAVGIADLCAAGVGAPHIRQRLWFVSHTPDAVGSERAGRSADREGGGILLHAAERGCARDLPDSRHERQRRTTASGEASRGRAFSDASGCRVARDLRHADGAGRGEQCGPVAVPSQLAGVERAGAWSDYYVLEFADGKKRRVPIERSFFPVVDGVQPARVASLRGSGNAIVPQVAAEFIAAYMEVADGAT